MASSSSPSPSRRSLHSPCVRNRSKIFAASDRIVASIQGKSCPICLRRIDYRRAAVTTVCMHAFCVDCIRRWSNLKRRCPLCNAEFDSWLLKISLSSRTFQEEQLPALNESQKVDTGHAPDGLRGHRTGRWLIRRSREDLNSVCRRTRPCRRQRTFGTSLTVPPDVLAERVLRWRASIYQQHLRAIPFTSQNLFHQPIAQNDSIKEGILRKIEPWIHRELKALLGDPDPSVIVHLTTSLFISSLEKAHCTSGQSRLGDDFLAPLQAFLHDWTDMFWHELRCFADSPFNMETYDTVVAYE